MPVIEFDRVSYRYEHDSTTGRPALDEVSFAVEQGEFVGIIGANASGKSTLAQLLNGLLCPTAGKVKILGKEIKDNASRDRLWTKVGLLFQQPEQQLFEATVFEDVAYGLSNMGASAAEVKVRVAEALTRVGLAPDEFRGLAPLSLSGGQRRRVAIAGVLAMNPCILVLDEPTAGLDGPARKGILSLIKGLQTEMGTTVIMISHNMGEVLELADKVAILEGGRMAAWGNAEHALAELQLQKWPGMLLPESLRVLYLLQERGKPVNVHPVTREGVLNELLQQQVHLASGMETIGLAPAFYQA